MTGGARPKQIGRDFERKCRAELEAAGYWVTQTPPSNDGGVDLVAIKPGQILAVQCKRAGYLGPADRWALFAFTRYGMVPILASRIPGKIGGAGIRWQRLADPDRGVAPCWEPFRLDEVLEKW